ncbi:MAG TPA: winged helix-turn-helix transcriptional regulator [Clostridiales bacterium]|nr:winged helix-turn-helix transcriptional regulator [Clostridiales bacterium]
MKEHLQHQLQTLTRLYKQSDHVYRNLASRFGLSDTEFWILYAIFHTDEPLTQKELCSHWHYPVQTIHSAVSNLLKKGLVRLEVIPRTKNQKKILLTEEGKTLSSNTISKVDEMERNAFLKFSEEERETYLSLFKRYLEYLAGEEKRVLNWMAE